MNFAHYLFIATVVALRILRFWRHSILAANSQPVGEIVASRRWPTKMIMAVIVSLAVLGSALFIILSGNYDGSSEKWAFGAVGTIMGYWLKGN